MVVDQSVPLHRPDLQMHGEEVMEREVAGGQIGVAVAAVVEERGTSRGLAPNVQR